MATVFPNKRFDADKAAKDLRAAMKGMGTNEKLIVDVLVNHDCRQRQEIKHKYNSSFGRDLIKDLKSELKGNFEDAVLALMTPTPTYLAQELQKAMKGMGTDESTMIEILCAHTNSEIQDIKRAFNEIAGRDLADAVAKETAGSLQNLFVSQVNAGRDENQTVDKLKAKKDAHDIFDAGEGKFGTTESVFNTVLCTRSYCQLRETFECYRDIAGHDIEDAIKKETKGKLEEGLLAIVQYAKNRLVYFSQRLRESMKGAGTDDSALVRLVISRSEIDLADIANVFLQEYGKSLSSSIGSDCRGDYKNLLLGIVGGR